MLTLWYIILGWKEYNKPFRKVEQPTKPVEPAKKPDLVTLKKDVTPSKPTDIKKPESPSSISPKPPAPFAFNNKTPEIPPRPTTEAPKISQTPKIPETPKTPEPLTLNNKAPETPKAPEVPKLPENHKPPPKTPEVPKLPDSYKPPAKTPEVPKTAPKAPEPPKLSPKTPESPKVPDFRLAPEPPKKPDVPKTPEDLPKTFPSRSPDASVPDFGLSGRNPAYVPPPQQAEFPIPPYLPGAPPSKPSSREDELFSKGSAFPNPGGPTRPSANLRDLSYAKGELPGEEVEARVKDMMSRIPKYMEQSVISNPDSLESDEEDVEF